MRNLFLGTVFILGVLTLGRWLSQSWAGPLAQGLGDLSQFAWYIDSEQERERDLAVRSEAMTRCIEGKKEAIREVLAGQMSLLEAAAHCRELTRSRPDFDERLEQLFRPGRSLEEKYCREVIELVQMLQPEQAQDVTRRLEAELEDRLLYGMLRLPW